jgi:hypothetical protein
VLRGRPRALRLLAGYYLVTGLVPFLSRRKFEAVTGPKRDWWLVQTVSGLVLVVGGTVLGASMRAEAPREVVGLAAGSAVVLAAIDVAHVAKQRIAPVYLLDAAVQASLLVVLACDATALGSNQ